METNEEPGPGALPTDSVLVRGLAREDLSAVLRIDRAATGRTREEYYRVKLERTLSEPKLSVSLVAELDDHVVGFVFAGVYYGEFGRPEPIAVLDAIGVDPGYRNRSVGSALLRQLEMNLRALCVERIETQVEWTDRALLAFLAERGFAPAPRLCLALRL